MGNQGKCGHNRRTKRNTYPYDGINTYHKIKKELSKKTLKQNGTLAKLVELDK